MKGTRGFTLLELLMVVVIIAILASLALPQYIRTAERAKMSEALSMLASLRSSAIRFHAERGTYLPGGTAVTMEQLDVDPADMTGTANFTYTIPSTPAPTQNCIVFEATRIGATAVANCALNYVIAIDNKGGFSGRSCQTATTTLTCP